MERRTTVYCIARSEYSSTVPIGIVRWLLLTTTTTTTKRFECLEEGKIPKLTCESRCERITSRKNPIERRTGFRTTCVRTPFGAIPRTRSHLLCFWTAQTPASEQIHEHTA